jgi:hypothetical protein
MHNSDPTPQDVENRNILLWFKCVLTALIDSSEARKQYDEYCLSIMQTITCAHDRTHIRILIAPQGYVGLCPKNIYSCPLTRTEKKSTLLK